MLRAVRVLFFLSLIFSSLPALAEEPLCECGDPAGTEISYQLAKEEYEPWADEMPWIVLGCSSGIDPLDGREKIFVTVELLGEDSPQLDQPFQTETENEIFFQGSWHTFPQFEGTVREPGICSMPIS